MKSKGRERTRVQAWKLWVIVLGAVACLAGPARAADLDGAAITDVFQRAAAAYDRGDFDRAVELYDDLVRSGFTSGEVFYDLGNAYYRMGSTGYALLNYRRAELLLPRDRDVRENVRLARARVQDRFSEMGWISLARTLAFWNEWLAYRELFAAFLAAQAVFWCLLGLRQFFRPPAVRAAGWVALGVALALGATLVTRTVLAARAPAAIVVEAEVPVTSGPAASETVVLNIHEGTELAILAEDSPYLRIRLPNGKEGWVPESRIERVVPGAGAAKSG